MCRWVASPSPPKSKLEWQINGWIMNMTNDKSNNIHKDLRFWNLPPQTLSSRQGAEELRHLFCVLNSSFLRQILRTIMPGFERLSLPLHSLQKTKGMWMWVCISPSFLDAMRVRVIIIRWKSVQGRHTAGNLETKFLKDPKTVGKIDLHRTLYSSRDEIAFQCLFWETRCRGSILLVSKCWISNAYKLIIFK